MSALTPLPSPRPHAVSAASAQEAEREEEFLVASRPHLRLVTDDFVPETSRADPVVELPVELARRPVAPRAAPSARREGRAVQARPADLAPHHPAVRAQRRRREAARTPGRAAPTRTPAVVRAAAPASPAAPALPAVAVVLRRAGAAGLAALAPVLLALIGIALIG